VVALMILPSVLDPITHRVRSSGMTHLQRYIENVSWKHGAAQSFSVHLGTVTCGRGSPSRERQSYAERCTFH